MCIEPYYYSEDIYQIPTEILSSEIESYVIENIADNLKNEDQMIVIINKTALSRLGKPKEISDAILFLMSDNASFITGHILKVDGGRL